MQTNLIYRDDEKVRRAEILSKDLHGGPWVDENPDGTIDLTYYGHPGGMVRMTLSPAEKNALRDALE